MPNLVLCDFDRQKREVFRDYLEAHPHVERIDAADETAALRLVDSCSALAVVPFWSAAPNPRQLEAVREFCRLQVPVVPVLAPDLPAAVKSVGIEAGAIDCVPVGAMRGRLLQLIELFTARFVPRPSDTRPADSPIVDLESRTESRTDDGYLLQSPAMQQVSDRLLKIAGLNSTILLTGATGVGKSSLARWIHDHSSRRNAPFREVACGSIPYNLVESELFGHVRGSFTGSDHDHEGKFSVVRDGTLLLDEIDCLPLEVQAKLLRVVEQRCFEKIGSHKTERFHARLIAATNRPLDQLIAKGEFRPDLYYRLGVISFRIPTLQERADAIIPLAMAFALRFAKEQGQTIGSLSPAVISALQHYAWPGNIRELRNTMEYAVAFASGNQIRWSDLPDEIRYPERFQLTGGTAVAPLAATPPAEPGNQLAGARRVAEREMLLATLQATNNNRTKAAAALGVSRMTLYKRMERLNISHPKVES